MPGMLFMKKMNTIQKIKNIKKRCIMSLIIRYMFLVLVLVLIYYVGKSVYIESTASAQENKIVLEK